MWIRALLLEPGKLRSFAPRGTGGVRKTQIAIDYALTRKSRFDAIFWVQADERQRLDRNISQITPHLGLTTTAEAEDQSLVGLSLSLDSQTLTSTPNQ